MEAESDASWPFMNTMTLTVHTFKHIVSMMSSHGVNLKREIYILGWLRIIQAWTATMYIPGHFTS